MNTTKVHVKNRPSLSSSHRPEEPTASSDVHQLILEAQRACELVQRAAAGDVPSINLTHAQTLLAATREIHHRLEQLRLRVEAANTADGLDVFLLGMLFSLLDDGFDQFLYQSTETGRTA